MSGACLWLLLHALIALVVVRKLKRRRVQQLVGQEARRGRHPHGGEAPQKCALGRPPPKLYTDCRPVPADNYTRHTIIQNRLHESDRWGNVLSIYWAARAWAQLNGLHYRLLQPPRRGWMRHLPAAVRNDYCAVDWDASRVFCEACPAVEMRYVHECFAFWTRALATVRRDTRAAVAAHLARLDARARATPVAVPLRGVRGAWLLYDRCEACDHRLHGPYQFRLYDVLPASAPVAVYYWPQAGACGRLQRARNAYIQRRRPLARVQPLPSAGRPAGRGPPALPRLRGAGVRGERDHRRGRQQLGPVERRRRQHRRRVLGGAAQLQRGRPARALRAAPEPARRRRAGPVAGGLRK